MIETKPQRGAAAPTSMTQGGAIERMLRRSLLLLTRTSSTIQDYFDVAELAEEVGAIDVAGVTRDIAMLRQGFGAKQDTITKPTGSIERAVSELRALMDDPGATPFPTAGQEPLDAVVACSAFSRLLSAPLDETSEGELAGLLIAWRVSAEAQAADPRDHADAALPALIMSLAASQLAAFLHRNHALAFEPHGSARLLHRAARLGIGGLGPYLSGTGNIVRSGRDVLGLIVLAAGEDAVDKIEAWVAPLAAYLPVGIAEDLADELADLGMIGAVRALLQAELRRSDRVGALQRLRDAALDLGDLALALTAQHHLANLKHLDALEWRCLGDMLATVGSSEAAEAAFIRADKLAPGDPLLAARLTALRSDDFGDFTVRSGFATPEPRKQLRFARRQA